MCGIAGILHRGRLGDAVGRVQSMASSIRHRGPDDDGFWSDEDIALGFRRLAIVDLATGHQPMPNEDATVQVVFNGEIYNHRELRRELEAAGHRFATDHSDTEVLVHGYEEWGEDLIPRLNGMFAFAVWDQRRRHLMLARDRLGIKPLYVARTERAVLFASEARALHASGLVAHEPDSESVLAYFHQQDVWRGRTMFRNVHQLEPGCMILDDGNRSFVRRYWDLSFRRSGSSMASASEQFRSILERVIARQMAADVPVMSYLSGGIDSTAITAGAARISKGLRAYSCIFDIEGVGDDMIVDERQFSRDAARHLGVERIELLVPQDALVRTLHATVDALEEPRMGMAYVNYLIASRVAADGKVVLSGCGGDELLGGYVGRYGFVRRGAPRNRIARLSESLRWNRSRPASTREARDRIGRLYAFLVPPERVGEAFTRAFWSDAGGYDAAAEIDAILAACPSDLDWDLLAYIDAKTYLAGLLMVEDKLSMAHSLETRVPLVDNEIIDFATSLDWSLLCDGTTGKKVFRDAIRDWVPASIADKPKMGFGPPDASWYRGRLQPFIRRALARHRVEARGVFLPGFVTSVVDDHMSGKANQLAMIWSLLSFEAWCEKHGFYGGDLGEPLNVIEGV